MRKKMGVLLVAGLCMGLTACSSGTEETTAAATTAAEETTAAEAEAEETTAAEAESGCRSQRRSHQRMHRLHRKPW